MWKGLQRYDTKKTKLPKVILTPRKAATSVSVFGKKVKEPDKGIIFSVWREGTFDLGKSLRGKKIVS